MIMRRCGFAWAAISAAVLASGCLSATVVVTIKPDGSGTMLQTVKMNAQLMRQAVQVLGAFQGSNQTGGVDLNFNPLETFKEEALRKAATDFGPGVRYVSSEPIADPDGEGFRAVYAFDNISQVNLPEIPNTPLSGTGTAAAGTKVRFLFDRGETDSVLTVVRTEMSLQPTSAPTAPPAAGGMPGGIPAGLVGMIQPMVKGMRLGLVLQVDGRIVSTTAPASLVSGSQITIVDVDVEKLLADPANLDKLQSVRSLNQLLDPRSSMPGVRMMREPRLIVFFSAR